MNENYLDKISRKYEKPESANRPEYLEKIKDNAEKVPFEIESLGDLSYQAASGIYMMPMIPALISEMEYTGVISGLCEEIIALRNDDEALKELNRFADSYRNKVIAKLSAESRCFSTFIAGGSNFPVAQQEKRHATARKRTEELLEWLPKAKTAVKRNLGLIQKQDNGIISRDDPESVKKIKEKIALIQRDNEIGKAVNKVLKNKKLTAEEKAKQINNLKKDFTPFHSWFDSVGIEQYRLSLNNAEIKRLQGRLSQLEYRSEKAGEQAQKEANGEETSILFDGGKIFDNIADNRLQIFFDDKPSTEIRTKLKSNGFRWSPSNSAWQSYRGEKYIERAKNICMVK